MTIYQVVPHKQGTPTKTDQIPRCNICGGRVFVAGPLGRKALTGRLPCCKNCGSLERHRIIRKAWDCFPLGFLRWKSALQFSLDPGVEKKWFKTFEVSLYGIRNSLDLQDIDRQDGSYDIVICNHLFEHVREDRLAFREVNRIIKSEGFLQFSVPSPKTRKVTEDWGYPKPEQHQHYRVYGRDLLQRFGQALEGIHILEIDLKDEITGVSDFVYFSFHDPAIAEKMKRWYEDVDRL